MSLPWKWRGTAKGNLKRQIIGEIYHDYWLEESVILRYNFFSTLIVYSMQSKSKSQQDFFCWGGGNWQGVSKIISKWNRLLPIE